MCATCKDKADYNKFCIPLVLKLATTGDAKNINGKIYTAESFLNALQEYKRTRIAAGTAFLGMCKYYPDGRTAENFYENELNFWNSIGIIKNIDPALGFVEVDCAYNYDHELWVVTVVYDAECIDRDANLYKMIKIKGFYLSRKFQFGYSITDGKSIRHHLKGNKYVYDSTVSMDFDKGIDCSFYKALDKYKDRIMDIYSNPAAVVDEDGNRIGLIYDINEDFLISYISKDRVNRFDYNLVPICNTSEDNSKVVSILNFKLVPKFKSKEVETIK